MREKEYLKQGYAAILSYTGMILVLNGILMLLPLLVILFEPRDAHHSPAFLVPALIQIFFGMVARKVFKHHTHTPLTIKEGGVIVVISWVIVILFSAWPLKSIMNINFSHAVFESVSGWTTTGLSILDVAKTCPPVLFWRSLMQLAGGAGLAIIMMSAIVRSTGVSIAAAEGKTDQLVPHVRESARLVLVIYLVYMIAGVIAYKLAGMNWFDSVNHSFAAISTGGFSTKAASIGHWNSVAVEAVSIPLMILGNLSFVTAWMMWRGKIKYVLRNGEVRLLLVLIPLAVSLAFFLTTQGLYPHLGKAVRVAVFDTISALTTTGFQTVDYGNWNGSGIFILVILMLIGGGTYSTAGGIKQFRIYLVWKLMLWEIKRFFLPRTAIVVYPFQEGERIVQITPAFVRQIIAFITIYLFLYVCGVLVLCASGFTLEKSLFEFASAIGTVGLSVGVTSANMPLTALWAETIAMFLGRLEFIVVIVTVIKLGKDFRTMLR